MSKLYLTVRLETFCISHYESIHWVLFKILGAWSQIQKQVKEFIVYNNNEDLRKLSLYIARHTMSCVSDLFTQAHKIKQWLIECCKISVDNHEAIAWISPMGMPIIQPYIVSENQDRVNTLLIDFYMKRNEESMKLSKHKQKSAFPPNFVHR